MDANTKYTLFVFNTCTQKYEEVTVSEEVYRTYAELAGTSKTMTRVSLTMRSS